MVDDGYEDVVNIDISSVAIETMRERNFNRPQLKYLKMDVRNMSVFQSDSFAAVIDKGTLDSLLCGHNSRENAAKMLREVARVLKANGVYILITYGAPTYRLHLLRSTIKLHVIILHVIGKAFLEASSEHHTQELTSPVPLNDDLSLTLVKNPDVHYIYVCIKKNCRTGCNFHQWHDPPVCGRSGNIIPGLLKRIERLEREIEKRARNEKRMK
ncbi:uncharacterized protein LOC108198027 [Daucus carota subsp. sativus]|uniref:uncharacterized protein LOC108198027 n=1 Tax=Daucus carota subsp. sativus TaxID=79200 RepID=UPI003082EF99